MRPPQAAPEALDHFLLTRFNVALGDRRRPSDEWLRRRLELFERFTVPSVRAQTCSAFEWLVFCDAASPRWLLARLEALEICTPVLLERWTPSAAATEVAARRTQPLVITSRVDNDDALNRRFIASVQAHAVEGFVNFTDGVQLGNGRLYWRRDPSNAFISRVERSLSPTTVYVDQHQRLERHGVVHQVRTREPMWLQVVHDDNLRNELRGVRVGDGALAGFDVDARLAGGSWAAFRLEQLTSALRLTARVATSQERRRWLLRSLRRRSG